MTKRIVMADDVTGEFDGVVKENLNTMFGSGQELALIEDPARPGTFTVGAATPTDPDPAVPAAVSTVALNAMSQGVAFSQTLTATGDAPITWSVSAGTLPAGLTLNASTGVLSGTPTGSGAFSFTVRASNDAGSGTKTFTGTIVASGSAPVVSSTALNPLTQGVAFSQTLTAAGSTPITWAVTAGTLPAGLTLSSGGVLSGTPTGSGAFSFTVTATNGVGGGTKAYSGTITAATTGGGGSVGSRVASYGPNGTHWPTNTPLPTATFAYDVEVDPTWTAIQAAITAAPASGNARIQVRPGVMPAGNGNGSTDAPTMSGGPTSRASKILIVPRDGFGTVTMNAASTIASQGSNGYSFSLANVAMLGFDFRNQGVVLRSCQQFAIGWGRFGVLNVTGNAANSLNNELIECVLPDQIDSESDHSAVRVANGYSVLGLKYAGCYFAPSYKANGSSSHCDTIQFSSTGSGGFDDVVFEDTILFQSSSQTLQLATVDTITFDHSAFIGGLRATGRFPIASGRHVMVGQNTLWGGAQDARSLGSTVVMGSINSAVVFTSVTSSVCSTQTALPSGWTVNTAYDGQSTLQTAWMDANSPVPSAAYLASIWAALA